MSNLKSRLEQVGQLEKWSQAADAVIQLKEIHNLKYLAVLSPQEFANEVFAKQILAEIMQIMPPAVFAIMLNQVTPTDQPIEVLKDADTLYFAYQPTEKKS